MLAKVSAGFAVPNENPPLSAAPEFNENPLVFGSPSCFFAGFSNLKPSALVAPSAGFFASVPNEKMPFSAAASAFSVQLFATASFADLSGGAPKLNPRSAGAFVGMPAVIPAFSAGALAVTGNEKPLLFSVAFGAAWNENPETGAAGATSDCFCVVVSAGVVDVDVVMLLPNIKRGCAAGFFAAVSPGASPSFSSFLESAGAPNLKMESVWSELFVTTVMPVLAAVSFDVPVEAAFVLTDKVSLFGSGTPNLNADAFAVAASVAVPNLNPALASDAAEVVVAGTPNLNPALEPCSEAEAGTPNLNPVLELDAGVDEGTPNLNPDDGVEVESAEEVSVSEVAGTPNLKLNPDFDSGSVTAPGLGTSQAMHFVASPLFLTKHVSHSQLDARGLNRLPKPGPFAPTPDVAGDGEAPSGAVSAVPDRATADDEPGLGVSQATHLAVDDVLLIMQVGQLQLPAAGLNFSHRACGELGAGVVSVASFADSEDFDGRSAFLSLSVPFSRFSTELGDLPRTSITLPPRTSCEAALGPTTSLPLGDWDAGGDAFRFAGGQVGDADGAVREPESGVALPSAVSTVGLLKLKVCAGTVVGVETSFSSWYTGAENWNSVPLSDFDSVTLTASAEDVFVDATAGCAGSVD